MLYLQNPELKVWILDPYSVEDVRRFGPRFCNGVYIYQIEKNGRGPMLSGPYYPAPFPPVSDGQGLPEVFQPTFLDEDIHDGDPTLIIGVGEVSYNRNILIMRRRESVISFCRWEVEVTNQSVMMATHQELGENSFNLFREAHLISNSLKIITTIQNICDRTLSFRWFAHPFYQLIGHNICCTLFFHAKIPINPGFSMLNRKIRLKTDIEWDAGYYQLLDNTNGKTFKAKISHPDNSSILMRGNFPLAKVALWANNRTFSIEPFYEWQIPPSKQISWEITYTF